MRLWTIQHEDMWQAAVAKGVLQTDGRRVDRDFRPAYRWLMGQMSERLPRYNRRYPVWAWAQPKPDLRRAQLAAGSPGVRIAFEADETEVLLSCFMSWHVILNDQPCTLTEAEDDAYDAALREARGNPARLADLEAAKRQTWPRIFDLDLLRAHAEWVGPCDYVQATLGQVSLDQVVAVDHFRGR